MQFKVLINAHAAMNKKAKKAKRTKAAATVAPEQSTENVDWEKGTKKLSKKQIEKKLKREEAAERKRARDLQMKLEEEQNSQSKSKAKGGRPGRRSSSRVSNLDKALDSIGEQDTPKVKTINAEGLENALEALSLLKPEAVRNKDIDRHPERRYKAALRDFTTARLPSLRKEYPGLRKRQLEQMAYQEFKESDQNPFNMETNIAYNATGEEVEELKRSIRARRVKKYEH